MKLRTLLALASLFLGFSACDPNNGEERCVDCHGTPGSNNAIEDAHPGSPLTCTQCHGGDAEDKTQEGAHVALPAGVDSAQHVKRMTSVELDAVPLPYVQWVNPSDYRVADKSCGGSDCHQEHVEAGPSSIMTTMAGHFNKTRYLAGGQIDRPAEVAVRDATNPQHAGEPGTVDSLSLLVSEPLTEDSTLPEFLDHYLEKGCPRCHVYNFGNNNSAGDFRSSGCAGCHMPYGDDGLSRSADPTVNPDDPTHPVTHQLTSAIPSQQCEHCHYRGNRIGTMYRGVREQARIGDPAANLERSVATLHTREPGFFIFDEDTTNSVDETPPDLHYTAGLGCVDCHVGKDVHGDGNLYSAHDYQVGVECEDCHGTSDKPISAGEGGIFRNTGGHPLTHISVGGDGKPVLLGRLDGKQHPLKQIADSSPVGHEVFESGGSHLDRLECYSCHSSWTQSCFGCHVTVDTRYDGKSLIDGTETPGQTRGTRSYVALDYLALGVGTDGKLTPMAPQEKMYVTAIVPCDPQTETCTESPDSDNPGKRVFDQVARVTADGKSGMGFGPVVPHTTSRAPQPCDRCHLREDESNMDIVRETLGWGSGRVQIPDGAGVMHDLTRVADEQCEPLVGLGHEGTGVVPKDVADRMLIPRVKSTGLKLRDFPEWKAP